MLEVGEAISKARIYLNEIMPEFVELKPQIEEMVFSEDSPAWKITFVARLGEMPKTESLADLVRRRVIEKVVMVGAEDGALISVKNSPF